MLSGHNKRYTTGKRKKTTTKSDKKRQKSKCFRNYCNYFVVITFILTVIEKKNECKTNPRPT